MNLVAKEYVAVKQDNPGVLVLSEMAGAAVELTDALLVSHILAVFANGEARYRAYGKHTDERFWTEKFPLQQILDILASHES